MTNQKAHEQQLKPGDVLNIDNNGTVAMRIRITTAAKTSIASDLPPGGRLVITAGHEPLSIEMVNADPDYRGLSVIK